MALRLATVTFLVRDYDEALAFFTGVLGFRLREDVELGGGKRWVVVTPGPAAGPSLLLARAASPEQAAAVGRQAGGRVAMFLETDDFDGDHAAFIARGVRFLEPPRDEAYGRVAVFEDLYGGRWDLIETRRG